VPNRLTLPGALPTFSADSSHTRALQYSAWTTHRCWPAAFAGKYHRARQKSSLLLRYFPATQVVNAWSRSRLGHRHRSGLQRRRRTGNSLSHYSAGTPHRTEAMPPELPDLAAGHRTGAEPRRSCSHLDSPERPYERECRRIGATAPELCLGLLPPLPQRVRCPFCHALLPLLSLSLPLVCDSTERQRHIDAKASEAVRPSSHVSPANETRPRYLTNGQRHLASTSQQPMVVHHATSAGPIESIRIATSLKWVDAGMRATMIRLLQCENLVRCILLFW
jgi:hypothetical protein